MSWQPPVPTDAKDEIGRTWHVVRAWPDKTPGDYVLEVRTEGRTGVRAAHLRSGSFELVPEDDPGLPALQAEARHGEVISHRPHKRAVIRAGGQYIKVFRPGRAVVSAKRCAQMDALLLAGGFVAPTIVRSSTDVIVSDSMPGRTLRELGADPAVSDVSFATMWVQWCQAWTAQLSTSYSTARRNSLATLPLHPAEAEADDVWLWVNRWVHHNENVPESWPQRDVLRAKARQVTDKLLRTTPDPLAWAHGDLHDKQVIYTDGESRLGLLDFDAATQAEAARDLANLDVHLKLRLRLHTLTPERYLTAHTQVMTASEDLHVSPSRFNAYAEATCIRLACLYSFRPGFGSLASSFLDELGEG